MYNEIVIKKEDIKFDSFYFVITGVRSCNDKRWIRTEQQRYS